MSIIARTRPPVKPDRDNLAPSDAEPRTPYTQADLDWAAVAMNEDATDFDVALDEELEWPGSRSEYEAWLDQIAPTREELEARDRCDAFLGHED
jgi:hypothetical protein